MIFRGFSTQTNFCRPFPIFILLPAPAVLVKQTVCKVQQHINDITMNPITSANATALYYQLSAFYLHLLSVTLNYSSEQTSFVFFVFSPLSSILLWHWPRLCLPPYLWPPLHLFHWKCCRTLQDQVARPIAVLNTTIGRLIRHKSLLKTGYFLSDLFLMPSVPHILFPLLQLKTHKTFCSYL